MTGIEAITALMPNVPQVGVFDTAFHQTMPAKSYMYALPYKFYKEDGVRRYGFHGTSHRYVSQRVCQFLGVDIKKQRIVTCHVGNGGSITAVKFGESIDTSMGLTPTEGLMMGTRVGDIDPGALVFLMEKHNYSAADIQRIINKESGVAGVSEISSDMREIEAADKAGVERAQLALAMYEQRIIKYIGAYAAEMGGVDIIVFTGGVGENQTGVRENVCAPLGFMGVEINKELNDKIRGTETVISTDASKVKVVVIPTDEELMIARDTEAILNGRQPE
jgi:acetate kinase